MHLWPSMRIRDSFKQSYLEKMEWNLHKMKSQKKQNLQPQSPSSNRQKLLDDFENNQGDRDGDVVVDSDNHAAAGGALVLYRELLLILSCCYGYFCCGACIDDEEVN